MHVRTDHGLHLSALECTTLHHVEGSAGYRLLLWLEQGDHGDYLIGECMGHSKKRCEMNVMAACVHSFVGAAPRGCRLLFDG